MSRRFINQLGERESVDQVFLASDKQLRANRAGNLYLQLRLADRTGSVTAMVWNANDELYSSFENGDFVRVQGTTQFYNGALQMIVNRIVAATDPVDESDFVVLASREIDRMAQRLGDLLRSLENQHLRGLAESFLADEDFMARFTAAPAGIKLHHAYRGGLLEHVVGLMNVAAAVAPCYPQVSRDLLLMGAFLHDVGKIEELAYDRQLEYTDPGQLVGHIVQGVGILREQIPRAEQLTGESFPPQLRWRLEHLIVSHHGSHEFGSPRVPMTPEAIALHFLDNLDAKLHAAHQVIQNDANADSHWTVYEPSLGRKLFKCPPEE